MDQHETEHGGSAGDSEHARLELPAELQARVLQFLPPNECVLSGRLVDKDLYKRLSQPHHRTARFSQPLPQHTVDDLAGQPHLQQAFRQAPMRAKLLYLSAAASSGSVLNLEVVAWRLLRPCLFPELLPHPVDDAQEPDNHHHRHRHHPVPNIYTRCLRTNDLDPGAAAVPSGHAHAFEWLVQHGCPLEPQRTLVAAAEHCDLARLQQAWGLMWRRLDVIRRIEVPLLAAAAAVRSVTHQTARAKLAWLLSLSAEAERQQGQPPSHGHAGPISSQPPLWPRQPAGTCSCCTGCAVTRAWTWGSVAPGRCCPQRVVGLRLCLQLSWSGGTWI